jgi:ankyrin repeat protein
LILRFGQLIQYTGAVNMTHHLDKQLFNTVRNASAPVDDVVKLLGKGADPNRRGKCGSTPLERAAANGHFEIAKLLLDAGADTSIRSDADTTPLFMAAAYGHLAIVQLLLDHGAKPNAYRDHGPSPLYHAIWNGHTEVVKLLLRYGADPDYDSGGWSASKYAQRCGDTEMARIIKTVRWSPDAGRSSKVNDGK